MQPLYVVLLLFAVLWVFFFKLLSLYATRIVACSGGTGKFFRTTLTSLILVLVVFLLAELSFRLYGGVMNLF